MMIVKIPVLCCSRCNIPLAVLEDLLLDRIPIYSPACFAYELEILGQTIFAYSATNPGDIRFDVIRLSFKPSVIISSEPSAEHSWFPPYRWQMASCICGQHLGWSFLDDDLQNSFLGIIVTKLTEQEVIASELSDILHLRTEAVRRIEALRLQASENAASVDDDDEEEEEEEEDDDDDDDDDNDEDDNYEDDNEASGSRSSSERKESNSSDEQEIDMENDMR